MCIGNPLVGMKSKLCHDHSSTEKGNNLKINSAPIQQDLRPVTRLFARTLLQQNLLNQPENDDDGIGCRDAPKITKFFDTTAGIISIIRPCGIRLGTYECYTKESSSQLMLSLIDKFGSQPEETELKVIVTHVACEVKPFVDERENEN